jgi:hypothetical protein
LKTASEDVNSFLENVIGERPVDAVSVIDAVVTLSEKEADMLMGYAGLR